MKCVKMRLSPAMTLTDDIITLIQYCISYWWDQGQAVWTTTTQRDTLPKYTLQKGMVTLPEVIDKSFLPPTLGRVRHTTPLWHLSWKDWLICIDFRLIFNFFDWFLTFCHFFMTWQTNKNVLCPFCEDKCALKHRLNKEDNLRLYLSVFAGFGETSDAAVHFLSTACRRTPWLNKN